MKYAIKHKSGWYFTGLTQNDYTYFESYHANGAFLFDSEKDAKNMKENFGWL